MSLKQSYEFRSRVAACSQDTYAKLFHNRETILRELGKLNPYSQFGHLSERLRKEFYVADTSFWKFRCFFRELGGVLLSGTITEGVLKS